MSAEVKICVVAEIDNGRVPAASLEALAAARGLADGLGARGAVCALLAGPPGVPSSLAGSLAESGAGRVLVAEHPVLAGEAAYLPSVLCDLLERVLEAEDPDVVLFGASPLSAAVAPTLAARLGTGLTSHAVGLRWADAPSPLLAASVLAFGGRVMADIVCVRRPQMVTLSPGCWPRVPSDPGRAAITPVDTRWLDGWSAPEQVLSVASVPPAGLPLEEAGIIIGGGWGVGSAENWSLLEQLAEGLGGAVGCTRPPLDEGWAKPGTMIGISGLAVSPRAYLAVGLSGAEHHVVGLKDPGVVISLNSDPNAPIFEFSDYAYVGNFRPVIVEMINQLKPAAE